MTEVESLESEIARLKTALAAARARVAPVPVKDYIFATTEGPKPLSSLFGASDELLTIHNMGAGCDYCTLWADGLNGLYSYLASRCAVALVSPDAPGEQHRFATARGWRFTVVSSQGSTFTEDMGYADDRRDAPGVSAFRRSDTGAIYRTGHTVFGPGDDFCPVWPLFDLFGSERAWEPGEGSPF